MDKSAIRFSLIKTEDDLVKGFRLTASETDAECFCVSFPSAQEKNKARIEFRNGNIVFIHDGLTIQEANQRLGIYGSSEGGTFETPLEASDVEELQALLNRTGRYEGAKLQVALVKVWGKGFELKADLPLLRVVR